jgi:hypothetical protein
MAKRRIRPRFNQKTHRPGSKNFGKIIRSLQFPAGKLASTVIPRLHQRNTPMARKPTTESSNSTATIGFKTAAHPPKQNHPMKTTDTRISAYIRELQQFEREEHAAGRETCPLPDEAEVVRLFQAGEQKIVSSSWTPQIKPGDMCRFYALVTNFGDTLMTPMYVTCFTGPGNLGKTAVEMIAFRDSAWPVLSSEPFEVKPQQTVSVPIFFRAPAAAEDGRYLRTSMLYEISQRSQPSLLRSRRITSFRVKK